MASPQVENGYVRISTELFEALMKTRIPGEQRQVLDFIIRMSYGYQKSSVELAPGEISAAINLSRQHVYRAVTALVKKHLLSVTKKGYSATTNYRIQKNYRKWQRNQKRFIEPKKVQSVTKKGSTPIKDNKDNSVVLEIVEYLNLKTGKKFKPKTPATIKSISARLRAGYSIAEIKSVINTKAAEWKDSEKMSKFLRPSTLFGATNFENYINEKQITTQNGSNYGKLPSYE